MKNKKLLDIKIRIKNNLFDIESYLDGSYRYIINPDSVYDIGELKICISIIPEVIENIKKLVIELESEYDEMKTKEILNIETKIDNILLDIKNYAKSAYKFVLNPKDINDVDNLITCLENIPKCTNRIENLIYELEMEYEDE